MFKTKESEEQMKAKTYLTEAVETADKKAQYDSEAKKIVSDKGILSWIAQYTVEELKDYNRDEIAAAIEGVEVAEVPVYPGKKKTEAITGMSTVDKVPNEGEVTYDIRFYVITPKGEKIKLILNIEIQRDYYPGYDLVTRAVFYCARMLSAQLDTEFTADNYDDIKKVYSIWLCLDSPQYAADTITEYRIGQKKIAGDFNGRARYDLLSVIMIGLDEKSFQRKGTPLHGLLGTVFSEELTAEEKVQILNDDYGMKPTREMEGDMKKMGGLGDAIEERGIQRGIEKGIQILILDNLEEGIPKERILIKLKEKFQLTQEQAEERFEKYGEGRELNQIKNMRNIETERLLLRPLTQDDANDVFQWAGDPIVNKYMPYPLHKSVQQTEEWISSLGDKNEFCFCLKDSGKVIGAGSITHKEEYDSYELGYNLNRHYWGMGYATEAAKALIKWAYQNIGVRDFFARHANANKASGNVLKKCGFQFEHYGQYSRYDASEIFEASYYTLHLE